jgi:hypothetical protein
MDAIYLPALGELDRFGSIGRRGETARPINFDESDDRR